MADVKKMEYADKVLRAMEILRDDDTVFCDVIDELDSWNGFADGWRCYPMGEIGDIYCGVNIGQFLDYLTDDFRKGDEFFYHSIYGIESTDDKAGQYRDNTTPGEVYDELLENYGGITIYSEELNELIEAILEERGGE